MASLRIELPVGRDVWPLTVRPGALVLPVPPPFAPAGTPAELMSAALASPVGLGVPVGRAFTPDDRVAVVVDPDLPHLGELAGGLLAHLAAHGVPAAAVTFIALPGASDAWLADLPDEFADAALEVHAPADRQKVAYLAATKAGRRVYLNRTVVEADAVVVLTGRGFDPAGGHAGAERAVFPALSDQDTRAAADAGDSTEVGWLLGTPIFVQAVRGPGDTIAEVVAGLAPDAPAEAARRQDVRWKLAVPDTADLVVAAVAGDPARVGFADLAAAAAVGGRLARAGGRVAVLSTAGPPLPAAVEVFRDADDPAAAARAVKGSSADGATAAHRWATAARSASLFVASGWPDDAVEGLFATPLGGPAELQRLVDAADRVLVIPDADRTRADLTG